MVTSLSPSLSSFCFSPSCWSFVKAFCRLRLLFVPPVVAEPQSALSSSHLFCTSVTSRPQFGCLLFVCVLSATGKKCCKNKTFPKRKIISIYFGCSIWRWLTVFQVKRSDESSGNACYEYIYHHCTDSESVIALKSIHASRSCVPDTLCSITFYFFSSLMFSCFWNNLPDVPKSHEKCLL